MHRRIVRLGEETSDDAALAANHDRASYAETLLEFMQRSVKPVYWEGVAMARYGKAEHRIDRILDSTAISRGLTRAGLAAILLLGAPLIFLSAAASPFAPQAPEAPQAPPAPQAPQAPQAPARGAEQVTHYIIKSGDSWMGSRESSEQGNYAKWRAEYGSDYVWFRLHGRDYIINDKDTLAQFEKAMAPQREVNRQQDQVNHHQDGVNHAQDQVNRHQDDVNRAQDEVNHQQSLVNEHSGDQNRVNQLQSEVNAKQQVVNTEQAKVNQMQAGVNKEQDAVNQMQTRASAEVNRAFQKLFESAVRQGVAHELH